MNTATLRAATTTALVVATVLADQPIPLRQPSPPKPYRSRPWQIRVPLTGIPAPEPAPRPHPDPEALGLRVDRLREETEHLILLAQMPDPDRRPRYWRRKAQRAAKKHDRAVDRLAVSPRVPA